MEKNEYEPMREFHCFECEEPVEITNENTRMQLYLLPEYAHFSFLEYTCPDDNEVTYSFIDIEDVHRLGFIENLSVSDKPSAEALPTLQEFYDVWCGATLREKELSQQEQYHLDTERMLEAWHEFWTAYNPQTWEF